MNGQARSIKWLRYERRSAKAEIGLYKVCFILVLWVVMRVIRNDLLWFDEGHDFLMYHLPFGMKLFAPDSIHIVPPLEDLFRGAPLLIHYMIGVMWKAYPYVPLNATHMIGAALWLSTLPIVYLAVGRQVICFALLSLAAPLILVHMMSGYIDLPANIFVFLALVAIFQVQSATGSINWWLALGVLSLGAIACSKYTVMPLAFVASAVFAFVICGSPRLSRRLKIVGICLAFLMAGSWSVRNLILFGNPTYPLRPPVIGKWVPYTWDYAPSGKVGRPVSFYDKPQPIVTLASIFEISAPDADTMGKRYVRDQWGNGPKRRGFRMGGFWWPVVGFSITVILFAYTRGYLWGTEIIPFGILLAVTLFLPQSHELRYFLYIPLMLAFLVAVTLHRAKAAWEKSVILAITLLLAVWSWSINSPHIERHTRPLENLATLMGVDWSSQTPGAIICGKKVGSRLVLLTGPSLREWKVTWTGSDISSAWGYVAPSTKVDCPKSGIEIVGDYEF